MKSKILTIFKIALAAGLIFWLVQSGRLDFSNLSLLLAPQFLIPCLFLTGLGLYLCIERWRALMASQGIFLSSWRTTQLVLIGTFFNYFMPGGVGGDVVKAFYIAKDFPNSKAKVIISVLMDRIIGLFSMILLAIAIMLWKWPEIQAVPQLRFILTILFFLLLAFILFWTLIFSQFLLESPVVKKIIHLLPGTKSIQKVIQSLTDYRHGKKQVLTALILSLTAQTSAVLFFYVAGNGLGFTQVPFSTYLFVVPVGFMIQAIPIAPAGIGIGQAAFLFLFNLALAEKTSLGPSTITAFQLATFFYGLLGALCYLSISKEMKKLGKNPTEAEV